MLAKKMLGRRFGKSWVPWHRNSACFTLSTQTQARHACIPGYPRGFACCSFMFRASSLAVNTVSCADLSNRDKLSRGQRLLSSSSVIEQVTDEHTFDCLLRERELKMHRHPLGPVGRISKLGKRVLSAGGHHTNKEFKILDLDSHPADSSLKLAKEFPRGSLDFIGVSEENVKSVSHQVDDMELSNVKTNQSDVCDLKQYPDRSIDLVVSCYGLQHHRHPKLMFDEIHRVLRPGGTMIIAAWDHLGTEPIVNKMKTRVLKGRDAKVKDSLPLTPSLTTPHILENMINESGLWCISIDRGEYPLFLSRDRSPTSAFDLALLPIKKQLGSLVLSGERPHAFEDARAAFDEMIKSKEIRKDHRGRFVVDDNRYKVVVARRKYEDGDSLTKNRRNNKDETSSAKSLVIAGSVPIDTIAKFDKILEDSFRNHHYSPMSRFKKAVNDTVHAEGHDVKKIMTMDLGSRPASIKPESFWAEILPDACIHSADVFAKRRNSEEMKTVPQALDIGIVTPDLPILSSIPDKSLDMITCNFGLSYLEDPHSVMNQVHRVLKPGGSFVGTTWDSISLEHISNRVLTKVIDTDHIHDDQHVHVPTDFLNSSRFTAPHMLEKLIQHGGLSVMKSEHYEFPFVLAEDGIVSDGAFETATLPIRHILKSLEVSGSHPNAISDARKAFDEMLECGELMLIDKHGCLITHPNRFNLIVARRLYEEPNGVWTME